MNGRGRRFLATGFRMSRGRLSRERAPGGSDFSQPGEPALYRSRMTAPFKYSCDVFFRPAPRTRGQMLTKVTLFMVSAAVATAPLSRGSRSAQERRVLTRVAPSACRWRRSRSPRAECSFGDAHHAGCRVESSRCPARVGRRASVCKAVQSVARAESDLRILIRFVSIRPSKATRLCTH